MKMGEREQRPIRLQRVTDMHRPRLLCAGRRKGLAARRDPTKGSSIAGEFKARQCNTVLVFHLPPLAR
jgi:hypothetical protein